MGTIQGIMYTLVEGVPIFIGGSLFSWELGLPATI